MTQSGFAFYTCYDNINWIYPPFQIVKLLDIVEFLCFNVKIKIRISYSHWFRRTSYHIKKGFSSMLKIDIHCQHNDGSVKPTTYYPLKTRCEIMRYWRGKYLFLFIKRRGKLLTAIFKVKWILLLSSAARFLLHVAIFGLCLNYITKRQMQYTI